MSKKSKNTLKKTIVKLFSVLVVFGIAFGMGLSQVGIDELNEKGVQAVFEKSFEILEEWSKTTDSGDSSKIENGNTNKISYENRKYMGVKGITPGLNIYYFYVGQADCTLIESNGEYLLIDAGNNEDGALIVKHLKSMGITKIKYLVITHPHEDHAGGGDNVLEAFKVQNLYIPDVPKANCNTETYNSVKTTASDRGVKRTAPKVGHTFKVGEAICEVMTIDNNNKDMNLTSITLEITYGEKKFLFMGDAEIYNEELRLWNDVDVLKLGHHGSSTSTGEDFLMQVQPEIGIISCGIDNSYGHPHDEAIELIDEYGVETYRTDLEGTIHLVSDGIKIGIELLADINLDGDKD